MELIVGIEPTTSSLPSLMSNLILWLNKDVYKAMILKWITFGLHNEFLLFVMFVLIITEYLLFVNKKQGDFSALL